MPPRALATVRRTRPQPPATLATSGAAAFVPAPDVLAWLRATFIAEGGPLHNPEHAHLAQARLGVLWTAVPHARHMRQVWATAEVPQSTAGGWKRARHEAQLAAWFGDEDLDFLITLSAPALAEVDDATFCAVCEHELLHCGQARDQWGAPKFSATTGRPIYAIRGHDVEQFTSVVARYGADAAGVRALVEAATRTPLLTAASIAGACGTCAARAA